MEITRHEILSDKQRYHFFELPKLPDVDKIDFGDERELWLALFNAETAGCGCGKRCGTYGKRCVNSQPTSPAKQKAVKGGEVMRGAEMAKPKGTKLIYTFKSDVLFKMLFTRNPDLLKRLVSVLLNIPLTSIEQFYLTNTEMPPEEVGAKFCRLDINMIVDGKQVNIEIQVADEGNYLERTMFHWAKLFTTSLPSGEDYSKLPKTICISILGFVQFDCAAVHSEFAPMEITRHEILSEKQRYHFFELPKLPDVDKIDFEDERELWLALFNAETEEELEKLTKGGEVMEQAIQAYRGTAADEEFRYLERLREKRRHDEAQALRNARAIERKKWQGVVAEKDVALMEKEAALMEKNIALMEKDALIANLQALLNKKQ